MNQQEATGLGFCQCGDTCIWTFPLQGPWKLPKTVIRNIDSYVGHASKLVVPILSQYNSCFLAPECHLKKKENSSWMAVQMIKRTSSIEDESVMQPCWTLTFLFKILLNKLVHDTVHSHLINLILVKIIPMGILACNRCLINIYYNNIYYNKYMRLKTYATIM